MKILVINTGSSSIKYQLFDMDHHSVIASGLVEKIGEGDSHIKHTKVADNEEIIIDEALADHRAGLNRVVELLVDGKTGVVSDKSEITAVGHRVVHGGETFQSTQIIDEKVIEAIKENIPLAPLHNPPNLVGIEVATAIFPNAPQVAVFDTAFHHTMPEKAFLYAVPYDLYKNERVRRYGFHGTSHAYVAERAAEYLGKSVDEINIITVHLGNGASMAAIQKGKCIDTTMGLTPLEGLVMGTRSGDIDPALPFFLANHLKMSLEDIDKLLNKESGLKGLCGTNDMREVQEKSASGDKLATQALDIYNYRIKKYIGSYYAALGELDAIIFTAGIGENSPEIRLGSCEGLEKLGIELDLEKNQKREKGTRTISTEKSAVSVLVVPTNEELRIAQETQKVVQ